MSIEACPCLVRRLSTEGGSQAVGYIDRSRSVMLLVGGERRGVDPWASEGSWVPTEGPKRRVRGGKSREDSEKR